MAERPTSSSCLRCGDPRALPNSDLCSRCLIAWHESPGYIEATRSAANEGLEAGSAMMARALASFLVATRACPGCGATAAAMAVLVEGLRHTKPKTAWMCEHQADLLPHRLCANCGGPDLLERGEVRHVDLPGARVTIERAPPESAGDWQEISIDLRALEPEQCACGHSYLPKCPECPARCSEQLQRDLARWRGLFATDPRVVAWLAENPPPERWLCDAAGYAFLEMTGGPTAPPIEGKAVRHG